MQGAHNLGKLEDPEFHPDHLLFHLPAPLPQTGSFDPSHPLSFAPEACSVLTASSEADAEPSEQHLHRQGLPSSSTLKRTSSNHFRSQAARNWPGLSNQSDLTNEGKQQQEGAMDLSEVQQKLCLDNSRHSKRFKQQTFKEKITYRDGYIWRMYGQKSVQHHMMPRSYFKCANRSCRAKKNVQPCNDNTSMLWVTYTGQHTCQHSGNADHSTPVSHEASRALSSMAGSCTSPVPIIMEEGESENKPVEESAEHSSPTSQDATDRISKLCPPNEMDVSNDGKQQQGKCSRNLKDSGGSNAKYNNKSATETFRVVTDKDVFDDGFMWRKYGQKTIMGSCMPRSYFRCAKSNCQARKHTEGCDEDDSTLIVTYKGRHTCRLSENADKSSGEAVKAFPGLADSSIGRVPIILDGGDFENKFVDDSSIHFHQTSSHQLDDSLSWYDRGFEEFNQPMKCNVGGDVIPLQAENIGTIPSLYPLGAGTRVLLSLENTTLGESIFVGAAHYMVPSETLQFYFFNAKDMAKCVGVGLAQAKVTLHDDLSVTIEETAMNERKLQDTWMQLLNDRNSSLVMKVEVDATGIQAAYNGCNRLHVQTSGREKGEALSRLCGVGFGCSSQFVDQTYDAAEVSWPLLYDMALFILTRSADVQCMETNERASAGQASGSNLEGNNVESSIVGKLHGKRDYAYNKGNFQGGGDGDEDGFGCNSTPPSDDDDPPVVLKVTVHPLTRRYISETRVIPYGLEGASIAPKLVFEFCRNHECKRISIKTHTRLELASHMDVFYDTKFFGWYHTGIRISFGCEDTEGHVESGRVALLKQSSCRIMNPTTSSKYTTAKSIVSSKSETCTVGSQGVLKLGSALLGGTEVQGSWSGARMQQVEASNCGNIETTRETVCGGFSFIDQSSTEFPARASFLLFYPLNNVSIWGDREFLQGQGLFSTIEPSIEGTWIPLNGLEASPYLFKVARSLKLHARSPLQERLEDQVLDHKQEYVLPLYVNHAMSHLKSQRSKHIELSGDRQFVPNVLQVGSAIY